MSKWSKADERLSREWGRVFEMIRPRDEQYSFDHGGHLTRKVAELVEIMERIDRPADMPSFVAAAAPVADTLAEKAQYVAEMAARLAASTAAVAALLVAVREAEEVTA